MSILAFIGGLVIGFLLGVAGQRLLEQEAHIRKLKRVERLAQTMTQMIRELQGKPRLH